MNPSSKYRQLPLAIVGMACRVPGADNLGEFWDMLVAGRSAVGDLPPDRLDQELYYDPAKGSRGKTTTRRGALASRRFDHDRCPISPELVRRSDPTHLVMCQTAAEALRHADMDPMNLTLRNTGVYVGHTIGSGLAGDALCGAGVEAIEECLRETDAFKSLSAEMQAKVLAEFVERMRRRYPRRAPDDRDLTSNMAAGIISKGFGLTGPFMAVNAACASSLEALLQAGRALARGKIDMAIVGGASVCTRDWLVLFSVAQSMSATDSRPFDEAADGLIIAEAYAAVVIKTLERAVADGDPIHGVIRGMGVSSDGRGKSLWAPRREGQVEAIRRAYDSGVDPAGVQYIEAHATATQVGDATEIAALAVAFRGVFPEGKKIPITSAKANLGHALEAAGLIGVVKTALCMRHGLIPAAAKVERLNPTIDWAAAPVYVPLEPTPWPCPADGSPRRAGVNAFGVGGLNVHVVLDEYRPGVMGDSSGALAIAQRWPSGSATGPPLRYGPGTPCIISRAATAPSRSRLGLDGDDDAVAIVGIGCVLPGAHDVGQYGDLLRSGRDPKRPAPEDRRWGRATPDAGERFGGYVVDFQYDWRRHKIPPKQIERADPLQFMVLEAAEQALHDAGYDARAFDRRRTGVMVGTEFRGDFDFQLQMVLRLPRLARLLGESLAASGESAQRAGKVVDAFSEAVYARWPVLLDETGSFSASSLAGRIIKTWDLMGGGAAVDSGATSSLAALSAAVDRLVAGDCDMMVCVAAQRDMNPAVYEALSEAGRLALGPDARGPFDRLASGYVPGEGAVVFLLKRLADARRDGDSIRAILRGVEAVHDQEAPAGLAESLRRCLDHVGLPPALAMTDAAGLPDEDAAMVQAVQDSYASNRRDGPLYLGSVVGQIGHAGGASGGVSLLSALTALEEGTSPPTFGLVEPSAALARNLVVVRALTRGEPLDFQVSKNQRTGLVISLDKGIAYGTLIESHGGRPGCGHEAISSGIAFTHKPIHIT